MFPTLIDLFLFHIGKCISRNEPRGQPSATSIVDDQKPVKLKNTERIEVNDHTDASVKWRQTVDQQPATQRHHTVVVTNQTTQIEPIHNHSADESNAQLKLVKDELARCMSRTRDLEERIKQIPKLRTELANERSEKQALHAKLREFEVKQLKKSEQTVGVQVDTPSTPTQQRTSAIKTSTPIKSEERLSTKLFSTQRVCATSLESLNFRFANDSSPTFSNLSLGSGSVPSPTAKVSRPALKDSGCMTNASITRDVGTVTNQQPSPKTRCIATSTASKYGVNETELFTEQDVRDRIAKAIEGVRSEETTTKEVLFTESQLQAQIKDALARHEQVRLKNTTSVGVQCVATAKQTRHIGTITDRPKTPPPPPPSIQHSVGIMAVVDTRNAYSTAKPDSKSIGLDNLATSIKTRSTGINPIEEFVEADRRRSPSVDRHDGASASISLKQLDNVLMKSTTSLASEAAPTKDIGVDASVQCLLLTPEDIPAPLPPVQRQSIAIQHSPRQMHRSSQCIPVKEKTPPPPPPPPIVDAVKKHYRTEATDTRDLIRLHDTSINTDAPPKKRDRMINTDRVCTVNEATNTVPRKTIDHGTSTDPTPQATQVPVKQERLTKKTTSTVACSTETTESAAVLAAAKSCNTCLAKIEIKQQTTIKNPNKVDDGQQLDASSRIPRPTALISPRPERKFQRQNTYTISPTTTTSFTHQIGETSSVTTSARTENTTTTTSTTERTTSESVHTANDAIISELIAETVNQHQQCPAETLLR